MPETGQRRVLNKTFPETALSGPIFDFSRRNVSLPTSAKNGSDEARHGLTRPDGTERPIPHQKAAARLLFCFPIYYPT